MAQISFHIRDGSNPEWIYQYLDTLDQYPEISSGKEAYEKAKEYGYEVGYQSEREVPTMLKKIGVLSSSTSLTDRGEELMDVMYYDMNLFKNILHHLFYIRDRIAAAHGIPPREREMTAWSYAAIVDYLIDNSPYNAISLKKSRQEVANAVYDKAQNELPSIRDEVSIGPRSVSGALQFLRGLTPPVIQESQHSNNEQVADFKVRSFAPGEMLLLAIDARYSETDTDYGTPLLLNNDTIEALCRTLVLDESGFDEVLEWAAEYDQLDVEGVSKQVRLVERVALNDLI
jgi:hypothetical protein